MSSAASKFLEAVKTPNTPNGVAERAKEYAKMVNRPLYPFDLVLFVNQEIDRGYLNNGKNVFNS